MGRSGAVRTPLAQHRMDWSKLQAPVEEQRQEEEERQ